MNVLSRCTALRVTIRNYCANFRERTRSYRIRWRHHRSPNQLARGVSSRASKTNKWLRRPWVLVLQILLLRDTWVPLHLHLAPISRATNRRLYIKAPWIRVKIWLSQTLDHIQWLHPRQEPLVKLTWWPTSPTCPSRATLFSKRHLCKKVAQRIGASMPLINWTIRLFRLPQQLSWWPSLDPWHFQLQPLKHRSQWEIA